MNLVFFSFNFSILNKFPNLFCFSVLPKRETDFKLKRHYVLNYVRVAILVAPEILKQVKGGQQTLDLSLAASFKP